MYQSRRWILVGVCALAACDIPTEAPIIEQRWVLPLDPVILEQTELLPPSVSTVGSFYDVAVDPASTVESLDNLCPACAAFDGTDAAVPAFTGSFVTTDALPSDVLAATVAGGSVDITLTNGLSFDPLENGGSVVITIAGASGGPVLGTLRFEDATDDLPAGSVTMRTLLLSGGAVTGALETRVDVDVPGGQVASIDVSDLVQVDAVTNSLLVSSATVDADGSAATLTPQALDADLGDGIVEDIQGGTLILDVVNPFSVTFDGTITIGAVTKTVSIPADPTSQVLVDFTGAELRSVLGDSSVLFSGSGTLSGGPSVVTPDSELVIDPSIDLTLEIGG